MNYRNFTIFPLLLISTVSFASSDLLDSCFAQLQLSREQFRVDPEVLMVRSGTSFKLPVFEQWFQHPLKIPVWERNWRNSLLAGIGKTHDLHRTAASILSCVTVRDLIAPAPLDQYRKQVEAEQALLKAIKAIDSTVTIPDIKQLPKPVQHASAMLLLAAKDALEWRKLALRKIPTDSLPSLYRSLIEPMEKPQKKGDSTQAEEPFPESNEKWYNQTELLAKIDYFLMNSGADDLTAAFDAACAELDSVSATEQFDFRCQTRYGWIVLSGGSNSRYSSDIGHYLLIVDTGGDDIYISGGATGGAKFPIGLLIDTKGNDRYEANADIPSFGAGILGWGLLADLHGNDCYTSKSYSQGCGVAGTGILNDRDGDDAYDAFSSAQGFGFFGIGCLSDQAGKDTYHAYIESQGCGMTLGAGFLVDGSGDDRYIAEDVDILFPGQQSDKHNSSMSQGAGFGMRRDFIDGHSLAGGVGMLLDGAGNDFYSGGVFAQSVGYWFGIGVLDDRSGNDIYNAAFYAQSATAHMGISYLIDSTGNDSYTTSIAMGACCPHDFCVSIFLDEAGNDEYHMIGNSLGTSMNSSVALFVDYSGDDVYDTGNGFGDCINYSSTGLRAEVLTTGIFLDLGGKDRYSEKLMKNNTTHLLHPDKRLPILKGIGIDREGGTIRWE